jgi:hypothetical protein
MLTPTVSVTNVGIDKFRIIVLHPSMKGKMLLSAKKYSWRADWIGATGKNTGSTVPGDSGWVQHKRSKDSIYVDVDTTACQFADAVPKYFTSVSGGNGIHRLQLCTSERLVLQLLLCVALSRLHRVLAGEGRPYRVLP